MITDQPVPNPNTTVPIWDLVIADMKARDRVGRERYGTPLQANNGRDALVDAYQEALDMAVYLRQAIEERKEPLKWYTEEEIHHWLKLHKYSDQIAKELALLIATNHQLAFNKGWQMGAASERDRREKEGESPHADFLTLPIDCPWLCTLGFRFVAGDKKEHCGGWVLCLVDFDIDEERGLYGEELRLVSGGESGVWHVEIRSRAHDWNEGVGIGEYRTRGQLLNLLKALGK